jgi:hypothetical protein
VKNRTRHTGQLEIIQRLPQSLNGNARFLCMIDGYICRTAVDSCYADAVKNLAGKKCVAILGTHYGQLTIDSIEAVKA